MKHFGYLGLDKAYICACGVLLRDKGVCVADTGIYGGQAVMWLVCVFRLSATSFGSLPHFIGLLMLSIAHGADPPICSPFLIFSLSTAAVGVFGAYLGVFHI
jgi:hypothetical protein